MLFEMEKWQAEENWDYFYFKNKVAKNWSGQKMSIVIKVVILIQYHWKKIRKINNIFDNQNWKSKLCQFCQLHSLFCKFYLCFFLFLIHIKCKMSKIVHPNTYVFNKFHHESVVSQLKPKSLYRSGAGRYLQLSNT